MRGALALALVLSLGAEFPHREQLLAMTFGVVAFTLIVQGLTIKPLLRLLGLGTRGEDDYERARVRKIALSSALAELGELLNHNLISAPVYERFRRELETRLQGVDAEIEEIYTKDEARLGDEVRMARARLVAAEKSSIEQAFYDGLISSQTAMKMIDAAEAELNESLEKRQVTQPAKR
jgi:CPA1 family monovalent cation:H+ antiporter